MQKSTIKKNNLKASIKNISQISSAMELNPEEQKKKSLKYSIIDGSFYSMMVGFGESFLAAFAVFLKATNVQIGVLGSLPITLGSISQALSTRLISIFKSRKKMVLLCSILQALMYIPIALVYFFGTFSVTILIAFVCIYWALGAIAAPAWNSWMGDLVEQKTRGAYFGRRNKFMGFLSFTALLAAGYILQRFSVNPAMEYIGFSVIFMLAMGSRLMSAYFVSRKYEPPYTQIPESEESFIKFMKYGRLTNYGTLIFFLCMTNFGVYISAPFFTPYMLTDLGFSYNFFTIVTATAVFMKFIMMPIWGNFSDIYGTKKVLTVTSFFVPIVPLLWLFSGNIWYLILVQLISGFIWAGFEISAINFIYDTTTPYNRVSCFANYNILNGIAIFLGATLGGYLVRHNQIFWSPYLFVFIVSGIVRAIAFVIYMPKLKEAHLVNEISHRKLLLKAVTTMTTQGLIYAPVVFRKMPKIPKFKMNKLNLKPHFDLIFGKIRHKNIGNNVATKK